MSFRHTLVLLYFLFFAVNSSAFYYKGYVYDEQNKPLPYASIFVKNSTLGTTSNSLGEFSIPLQTGTYEIVFRYLGYETMTRKIQIMGNDVTENVYLKPSTILLNEAIVGNQKEDPAMTIMRKTIAMSVFHYKELDSYSFKTYLKGNMKIIDIPFVFEKLAKKNFIEKNQLYVFESIHKIDFSQPGKLTERVIAKKDNLPPTLKNSVDISLGRFEFYSPDNETSPVTKKGAKNYRYEYLGYFEDNGQIINKIKVIPKTKGYDSGVMNIVDGTWYVHSYDFTSKDDEGVTRNEAIFNPVDGVWFLSNRNVSGSFENFGAKIDLKAVISAKEIQLKKNPRFATVKPEIIDENIFKEKAKAIPKNATVKKEATLNDLKKLAKTLQKEEQKFGENVSKYDLEKNTIVDSSATEKDSLFWLIERQVPLTAIEIKGFQQADSIYAVNFEAINKKIKKDSSRVKNAEKLNFMRLFSGHTYSYGKTLDSSSKLRERQFKLGSVFEDFRFNAVEGYVIGLNRMEFIKNKSQDHNFKIGIKAHYVTQLMRLNGDLYMTNNKSKSSFGVAVGRKFLQVNHAMPVSTFTNELFALFGGRHDAKFYERRYINLDYVYRFNTQLSLNNNLSVEQRDVFANQVNYGFFRDREPFEPNKINHQNGNVLAAGDKNNRIFLSNTLQFSPKTRLTKTNNATNLLNENEPIFKLNNTFSFTDNVFGKLDFEVAHRIKIGSGNISAKLNAGFFYGQTPESILDYQHFMANQLVVSSHTGFRDLAYYKYSSDRYYVQSFLSYDPEKFFLTQMKKIRKFGMSEYGFVNILKNQYLGHQEIGYGLSLFSKKLSAEVFATFENQTFFSKGFRVILPMNVKK